MVIALLEVKEGFVIFFVTKGNKLSVGLVLFWGIRLSFGIAETEGKIVSFDNGVIVGLCCAKWVLKKNRNNTNKIFDIL